MALYCLINAMAFTFPPDGLCEGGAVVGFLSQKELTAFWRWQVFAGLED